MEYRIRFTGRQRNAIGITYPIEAIRHAENPDAAILALYDEFENVHLPQVDTVCPNCGQWQHKGIDCLNECKKRGLA